MYWDLESLKRRASRHDFRTLSWDGNIHPLWAAPFPGRDYELCKWRKWPGHSFIALFFLIVCEMWPLITLTSNPSTLTSHHDKIVHGIMNHNRSLTPLRCFHKSVILWQQEKKDWGLENEMCEVPDHGINRLQFCLSHSRDKLDVQ